MATNRFADVFTMAVMAASIVCASASTLLLVQEVQAHHSEPVVMLPRVEITVPRSPLVPTVRLPAVVITAKRAAPEPLMAAAPCEPNRAVC